MTSEHPLDRAFEELNRIIKKLEKHSKDPLPTHVDPSVLEMLDKVSAEVDQFEKDTKELNERLGISEEKVQKLLRSPPKNATKQHLDWIENSLKAGENINRLKEEYAAPTPQGNSPMDLLKKKDKKDVGSRKSQKERANKFRRMGGNQDWRPL